MGFYETLLILLLIIPAVGTAVVALLGPGRGVLIRQIALGVTLADLAIAVILVFGLFSARPERKDAATFQPAFVPGATAANPHKTSWNLIDFSFASGNGKHAAKADAKEKSPSRLGAIQFYIGLDGMNLWLIVLTALLMVSSVLISWTAITERVNEYYAWLLLLGTTLLGVFLAFDIILFYVFFELTLIPLFFLIGIWGGPERRHAAGKFFLYTLTGSLITFLGLMAVVVVCQQRSDRHELTFSIPELVASFNALLRAAPDEQRAFYQTFQTWAFVAMMIGFAVKVPLFPVHTWLPLAHVEAPTAGSVLLAGVLLKMGTYGFMRICLPLAPDASIQIGVPLIGVLSVGGIIYGALCARAQDDIKKLVAYSSVSHLGFCTLGMFALNSAGLTGSLVQMINHGLSTGALFLLVGMLYERYHTRMIDDYSGMGSRLGWISFCWVFISLSSVGLPGLNGFVGEALVFFGMFDLVPVLAVIGTAGIILGAWYLLTMLRQVFFGPLKEPHHDGPAVGDINPREIGAVVPIMALCLLLGVFPQPVLDSIKPDVDVVAGILEQRRETMALAAAPTAPQAAAPLPRAPQAAAPLPADLQSE
jgi:NADH-quinone oxidoreductase subunit M